MTAGIASLLVYIAVILIWNLIFKRKIPEAMVVAWIAILPLAGWSAAPQLFLDCLASAGKQEVVFASMAFIYMAILMKKTDLVSRLVQILNSVFGRIGGGAGYVSTAASILFGTISGSASGNAASVGTITIPWMANSGWTSHRAATLVAGNAALGVSTPPSSSMFLLLGLPGVASTLSAGDLYVTMFCAGGWTILAKIAAVRYFAVRDKVGPVQAELIQPLAQSFKSGWTSLLIFIGILLPVALTMGPGYEFLTAAQSFGKKGMRSISIIVWIPIIVSWITIFEGWSRLPKTLRGWLDFNMSTARSFTMAGTTIFFAFAASHAMTKLGLGPDMSALLKTLILPKWGMLLLVGLITVIVGGPLSSTATVVAVGSVGYIALSSQGIPPSVAASCMLLFSSITFFTPPNSPPAFIASGFAQVDPMGLFKPLVLFYGIPVFIIGVLVGLGILPVI